MEVSDQTTFRELDGNVFLPPPGSALEDWYISVRDTPISRLELDDLARACRQRLFPDQIVPFCLQRLDEDPLSGGLYDGEMVVALKNVEAKYWKEHPEQKTHYLQMAAQAFAMTQDPELQVAESDILAP